MTTQTGGVPGIDVAEAATRFNADDPHGPLLVDVREADELAVVHVADALHIPTSTFLDHVEELRKDRPLMIMCATGVRSTAVTAYLLRNGWKDVVNVDGGITAWQRAGLPVERG